MPLGILVSYCQKKCCVFVVLLYVVVFGNITQALNDDLIYWLKIVLHLLFSLEK